MEGRDLVRLCWWVIWLDFQLVNKSMAIMVTTMSGDKGRYGTVGKGNMVIMMVRSWCIGEGVGREGRRRCRVVAIDEVSSANGGRRGQSVVTLPSAVPRPSRS